MQELWQNQSNNLFLWVPFLMAFGAALYFNLSFEPNFLICIAIGIISVVSTLLKIPKIIKALALFCFGFCYAAIFTHIIATPQIPHELHNLNIVGTVENIDFTTDKTRIYIETSSEQLGAGSGEAIIRVSANSNVMPPNTGDKINANVAITVNNFTVLVFILIPPFIILFIEIWLTRI